MQTSEINTNLNALPVQDWIDLLEDRVALLGRSFSANAVDPEISRKLRKMLDDINWILEHNA